MNYIIIISNPKVIRVDFQTSNTATDSVKNLGQLLLQRLDNQVTEISTFQSGFGLQYYCLIILIVLVPHSKRVRRKSAN